MEQPLVAWQPFYVIVGTASAVLLGLLFVVMTLIAGLQGRRSSETINAYSTPSLIHFCAVFLLSGLISAPWHTLWQASILIGLTGGAGVIYLGLLVRRLRRLEIYHPVVEDWLFHALLPCIAYTALLVSAIFLGPFPTPALFSVGAVSLLLLFIGIHNAWDNLTYLVFEYPNQGQS